MTRFLKVVVGFLAPAVISALFTSRRSPFALIPDFNSFMFFTIPAAVLAATIFALVVGEN